MAAGSDPTAYTLDANFPPQSSEQLPAFLRFVSSSAWIYPIDRFFAHALYEYYYDIDFTDCAGWVEIQERNEILYESYCFLVGSLMVKACMDYDIKSSDIIEAIALVETHPELLVCSISQCHFNYVRAAYGIYHFNYIIMRYCDLYKLICCQDMITNITEVQSYQQPDVKALYQKHMLYVQKVIRGIDQKHTRVEEFLSYHNLPLTEELRAGPFLSYYGISLCNVPQKWLYEIAVSRLEQLNSEVQLVKKRQKELEDMLKALIDQEQNPEDTLINVLAILNEIAKLNKTPPAAAPTMSPLQQNLNKRTIQTRLLDEDFHSDLVPAKRQSFDHSTSAPPPSPNQLSLESSQTSGQELLSGSSQPSVIEKVLSKSFPSLSSLSHGHLSSIKPESSSWSSQVSPNAPESSPEISPESMQVSPIEQDSGSHETYAKQESLSESTQVFHTIPTETLNRLEEAAISSPLAAELIRPSFDPAEYKTLDTLPESSEEYLLHEYDRRVELHIGYNSAEFMLLDIAESKSHLKSLIEQQAMFEQKWPAARSGTDLVSTFIDKGIVTPTLLQEARSLVERIQQTINSPKS